MIVIFLTFYAIFIKDKQFTTTECLVKRNIL